MGRDRRLYVEDILQGFEIVQHYAADRDRAEISQDSHLVDVLMHNLEIIGEASSKVREKFHPDIRDADWDAILSIPETMANGHAEDNEDVWQIIETVIPAIHEKVRFYLV